MSTVFIIPYVPIPRMIKRINTACSVDDTSVIFWDRGTDKVNNLSLPSNVVVHRIYQAANEGHPLKRLGATFHFCRKAFRLLKKEKPSCIHVTKTDMLLLVWLYCTTKKNRPSVIYEVSDIHRLALNNSKSIFNIIIKKILYNLECVGMSIVDRLIVTSESFWTVYYKKLIPKESVLFLPNTPPESIFKSYKKKESGKFKVGFIGKVRYKDQLKMLIDASEKINVDVLIAGNGVDLAEIKEYSKGKKNVDIYGAYVYKDEIANLYGSIDCVYSVYDTSIQNVQIALPNRLYEAAICGLPIIVSKGTELAKIVEEKELGISIEDNNIDDLIKAIIRLKNDSYRKEIEINCKSYYKEHSYDILNKKLYNTYVDLKNH